MFSAAKAWILQYALVLLAGLLVATAAFAGWQTLRLAWLQASTEKARTEAVAAAFTEYQSLAVSLDVVAGKLLTTQQERDDAFKKTGRKVSDYNSRPGPAVQCFDDDGLQLIAELARGKAADPGASAGAVPGRAAGSD